jgi:hypothetical protein
LFVCRNVRIGEVRFRAKSECRIFEVLNLYRVEYITICIVLLLWRVGVSLVY